MSMNKRETALIIGAGPAGLTAAYELLERTKYKPIIFEMSNKTGGLCQTVRYKGNYLDIGGHRFFSKSQRVMDWWLKIMPIDYSNSKKSSAMLIRQRKSRIFFLSKFFDYPVKINIQTLKGLGLYRSLKIFFSFIKSHLFPIRIVNSLEDFFINRFGKELYRTFFKDYTEKVWGVPCTKIKADWGAQRIKSLTGFKTFTHSVRKFIFRTNDLYQKNTETSLIERFLYPKFGPGQFWDRVEFLIKKNEVKIIKNHKVIHLHSKKNLITAISVLDTKTGKETKINGKLFFSTMPVSELILAMGKKVPEDIKRIAFDLPYRNFITVGILVEKILIKDISSKSQFKKLIEDNWIYIQDPRVKCGRLQIFNNWSPFLVKDSSKVWLGAEYFCNDGDELWKTNNQKFSKLAIKELEMIGIIKESDVLDHMVLKVPKAYPSYFGTYNEFDKIIEFTNQFENLYLIGRNGMHKYNNSDHSMLTAMKAVDAIVNGDLSKKTIWDVNTESDYHEEKKND